MRPVLFHIGSIPVYSYGAMLMLGFGAGILWSVRDAKRRGLSPTDIVDFALTCLIAAIVGSRLVYVLLDYKTYLQDPLSAFMIWKGGLAFHGGLLGGILAAIWFCRARLIPFGELSEVTVPAVPLGYAITRIGCFLNGCCYGKPCSLPWAVRFPSEQMPGMLTPPSHPTQIYSAISSLLVFGIIVWARRWVKFPGQSLLHYLILYSIERFLIEFLRAPFPGRPEPLGLTYAQWTSVLMVVLTGVVWWTLDRKVRDRSRLSRRKRAHSWKKES